MKMIEFLYEDDDKSLMKKKKKIFVIGIVLKFWTKVI